MKKLSVVVPVDFNEGSLAPLHDELRMVEQELVGLGVELELIFVDDGSGDGSFAELLKIKAARPATRLVKLSEPWGVHASKTGPSSSPATRSSSRPTFKTPVPDRRDGPPVASGVEVRHLRPGKRADPR